MNKQIEGSPALWNRTVGDLRSDEVLAQLLDRGRMADWRNLYCLAEIDPNLRGRIKRIVLSIPVPLPHCWLAALAPLGETVDWTVRPPNYFDSTGI